MGCSYTRPFLVNDALPGQGSLALKLLRKLHLNSEDIDKFYTAFHDIDSDNSHYIRMDEICAYFKLQEQSAIISRMVRSLDMDKDDCLNFCEFVGMMWNLLSYQSSQLGTFAFSLFDKKGKGHLSRNELTRLTGSIMVHISSGNKSYNAKIASNVCKGKEKVDAETFQQYCDENREMCTELHQLQNCLRGRILGKHTWEVIASKRAADYEQQSSLYVQKLFLEMNAVIYKNQKVHQSKEFQGKVNNKLRKRGKEERRNSYLHTYFGLKNTKTGNSAPKMPTKQRLARRSSSFGQPNLVHKKHALHEYHVIDKSIVGSKHMSKASKVVPSDNMVYAFDDNIHAEEKHHAQQRA